MNNQELSAHPLTSRAPSAHPSSVDPLTSHVPSTPSRATRSLSGSLARFSLSLLIPLLLIGCTPTASDTGSQTGQNPDNNSNPITESQMKTTPEKGDTIATLKTNHGDIKMLLYSDLVPETVKNFTELAKGGKYNNTIFHRVIPDFMIQGGDFENRNGTGGYSYKGPGTYLQDEFGEGLSHIYGAVSMANRGPNTGGSQFFIVQLKQGTDWLDGKHAIFGYVYEGMDTIEKIAQLETDGMDKPMEDVVVESVEIGEY